MPPALLLVQPPLTRRERYGVLSAGGSSLPPFGLAWLAAVARRDGHEVAVLDAEAEGLDEESAAERIRGLRPLVAGFTATTISVGRAARTAQLLRSMGFTGRVVLGGPHVTAAPEATLRAHPVFELAVLGEGEATLSQLLPALLAGGDLRDVAGLALRGEGESVHLTAPRDFLTVEQLGALPLPAFELLPPLTSVYQPSALRAHRSPSLSLVTTRGCGGKCTFCDNTVFGRRVRSFPAAYVLDMVARLVAGWGVRDLTIYDDNFVVNRARLDAFCAGLLERKLDVSWSCNARVDVITEDLVRKVKAAGCWQMSLGIESGVPEILARECKGIELDQVRRAVGLLSAAGIRTKGFFMIGHPGETRETAAATVRLALELPLDDFQMSFLTPFPGTALHAEAARWGVLDERWDQMNMWTPVFVPHGMTRTELVDLQRDAMRRFYFRPRVLWRYLVACLTHPRRMGDVLRGGLALLRGVFSKRRGAEEAGRAGGAGG